MTVVAKEYRSAGSTLGSNHERRAGGEHCHDPREDVIWEMTILGAQSLILSLHGFPENNFSIKQTGASLEGALRRLGARIEVERVRIHLGMWRARPPLNLIEALDFIGRVGPQTDGILSHFD